MIESPAGPRRVARPLSSFVVLITELPLWVAWGRDTCILGGDENRPGSRLHRPAKFGSEPFVLTTLQDRLIWYRLNAQLIAEVRAMVAAVDNSSQMIPSVAFFQDKYPASGSWSPLYSDRVC